MNNLKVTPSMVIEYNEASSQQAIDKLKVTSFD